MAAYLHFAREGDVGPASRGDTATPLHPSAFLEKFTTLLLLVTSALVERPRFSKGRFRNMTYGFDSGRVPFDFIVFKGSCSRG